MITPKEFAKLLFATRTPYAVFALRFGRGKREIEFRNGVRMRLSWRQFKAVVGSDFLMRNYALEQVEDDLFLVRGNEAQFMGSALLLPVVNALLQKKFAFDIDCHRKVVLDVGGFQGESAVIFGLMGARKVIVYEPVEAHQRDIWRNARLNNVNVEIHMEGIAEADGFETIQYEEADMGFGSLSRGKRTMQIKVRSVADVISESCADIAKFNCEGAERSLESVPDETLRKIPIYVIFWHTQQIRNVIIRKFVHAGFKLMKEDDVPSRLYFAH